MPVAVAMFVIATKTDAREGATHRMRPTKPRSRTTYTMWGEFEEETTYLTRPHGRSRILSAEASKAVVNSRQRWIRTTLVSAAD